MKRAIYTIALVGQVVQRLQVNVIWIFLSIDELTKPVRLAVHVVEAEEGFTPILVVLIELHELVAASELRHLCPVFIYYLGVAYLGSRDLTIS